MTFSMSSVITCHRRGTVCGPASHTVNIISEHHLVKDLNLTAPATGDVQMCDAA